MKKIAVVLFLSFVLVLIVNLPTIAQTPGAVISDKATTELPIRWEKYYAGVYRDTVWVDSAAVDTSLWRNVERGGGEYSVLVLTDSLTAGCVDSVAGDVRIEYQLGYEDPAETFSPIYAGFTDATWTLIDIVHTDNRYVLYAINLLDPVDGIRFRTTRDDTPTATSNAVAMTLFIFKRPK